MDEIKAKNVLGRLKSETGEEVGELLDLPIDIARDTLQIICNYALEQEEATPYIFFVNDCEITTTLEDALGKDFTATEQVLDIVYQQQAVFRVRAVTRCTASIPGHAEAVIAVSFSPDGSQLASGSGDTTVRLWDIHTQTPQTTCEGHKHWVLCVTWSPDGKRIASGCKNGLILIWNAANGQKLNAGLTGHKQWITSLCWQPLHLSETEDCRWLVSAGKDAQVRIWDVLLARCLINITGHMQAVTAVKWGGGGLIYTGSQDRTIKVWRAKDGVLCRSLEGHAHWVNTLALSTDYVLRTANYDPMASGKEVTSAREEALKKYRAVCPEGGERLVSGSDDFTLYLWEPEKSKKSIARMTGHQQLVNDVKFSPDGRILASASFDKSIKLWDGRTGKFITTLRGHVQAVYQVAWSADSRLLVSGSADSTLKVWNIKKGKLELDLPGHADQVFAVDWSPDGLRVASGGKDKVLRLWQQ